MEFKISELEQEPIDFDLQFKAGSINYGDEAEQSGPADDAEGIGRRVAEELLGRGAGKLF